MLGTQTERRSRQLPQRELHNEEIENFIERHYVFFGVTGFASVPIRRQPLFPRPLVSPNNI